jgi:four helix bundle protein
MADAWRGKQELRERTKRYAASAIRAYCALPKNRTECQVLGRQLIRSGTSVAANYREASRARSDAEFVSKIEQCAQEADETLLWLELLREECGIESKCVDTMMVESDELIAIFTTMSKKVKARMSA